MLGHDSPAVPIKDLSNDIGVVDAGRSPSPNANAAELSLELCGAKSEVNFFRKRILRSTKHNQDLGDGGQKSTQSRRRL